MKLEGRERLVKANIYLTINGQEALRWCGSAELPFPESSSRLETSVRACLIIAIASLARSLGHGVVRWGSLGHGEVESCVTVGKI